MATVAGAHADGVGRVRDLLTAKGRREQKRFTFEGPTLLGEALRSNVEIEELYVLQSVLDGNDTVKRLDARGTAVFVVDERTMNKISDLETPTGLVAVAGRRESSLADILSAPLSLVLADLNDPGNAGTLLRSAEAFGVGGVVFGSLGVDPYHPKVVRGAMGAIFRLQVAVADPVAYRKAAGDQQADVWGLDGRGKDIRAAGWGNRVSLVVGHERRGLGPWQEACGRTVAIPMQAVSESLNAAVAGSIALYEIHAVKRVSGA